MIKLKAFSHDLRKRTVEIESEQLEKRVLHWPLRNSKMTVLPVVTGFLYPLRTQTIIGQKLKVHWPGHIMRQHVFASISGSSNRQIPGKHAADHIGVGLIWSDVSFGGVHADDVAVSP